MVKTCGMKSNSLLIAGIAVICKMSLVKWGHLSTLVANKISSDLQNHGLLRERPNGHDLANFPVPKHRISNPYSAISFTWHRTFVIMLRHEQVNFQSDMTSIPEIPHGNAKHEPIHEAFVPIMAVAC